jgi:hypothetical protein
MSQPAGADKMLTIINNVVVNGVAHPVAYDFWNTTVNTGAKTVTCSVGGVLPGQHPRPDHPRRQLLDRRPVVR